MRSSRWHLVLIAVLTMTTSNTQAAASQSSVEHFRLANGIDVVLAAEPSSPRVAVNVWFRRGSSSERPGLLGLAHLAEHLILGASAYLAESETSILASIGADSEGMTFQDHIETYAVAGANQLETLLWLRSNEVGFGGRPLTEQRLATEKRVVSNEIRQREERAFSKALNQAFRMLFPLPHPYHDLPGSAADVQRATLADANRYVDAVAAPGNVVLAICGGFEPTEAKKLVDKYFASLPARPQPPPVVIPPSQRPQETRVTVTEKTKAPRLLLAWAVPPPAAPERAEADLFPVLLGSGNSSLIQQRLVQELRLLEKVDCDFVDASSSSVLYCSLSLREGSSVDAVLSEFDRVLNRLHSGVDNAVLTRAKTTWRARWLSDGQDLLTRTQRLTDWYVYSSGRTDYLEGTLRPHDAISVESLQRAAARWLALEARVVVTATGAAVTER